MLLHYDVTQSDTCIRSERGAHCRIASTATDRNSARLPLPSASAARCASGEGPISQPLKREVLSQARRFISASQILKAESAGYIDGQTALGRSSSSSFLAKQAELSNDVGDCKKSLTDIRDRIGSLQSLLKQSRSLTSSRQQLLSEVAVASPVSPSLSSQADKVKKANFASNRNDSYSRAMDDHNEKLQVASAITTVH